MKIAVNYLPKMKETPTLKRARELFIESICLPMFNFGIASIGVIFNSEEEAAQGVVAVEHLWEQQGNVPENSPGATIELSPLPEEALPPESQARIEALLKELQEMKEEMDKKMNQQHKPQQQKIITGDFKK